MFETESGSVSGSLEGSSTGEGVDPAQPMVHIPAGVFIRGSDITVSTSPEAEVYLSEFWIDQTEVTVDSFLSCEDAGVCEPAGRDVDDENPALSCNAAFADRGDHPINCVSKEQAVDFCAWVGKRLPTEHEWEKSARGTDARTYPWGEEDPYCGYAIINRGGGGVGCGERRTWPVGSVPMGESPYGVLDMTGNVAEWVSDWFAPYPEETPDDYQGTDDPSGGAMTRGGGFINWIPGWEELSYYRHHATVGGGGGPGAWSNIGFRCASSQSP